MDMREREQKEATARFRTVHGYGRFGEESKSVKYDNKNGPELEGNSLEKNDEVGVGSNHRCILPGSDDDLSLEAFVSQRENGLIGGGCCALARLDGVGFCLFRAGK